MFSIIFYNSLATILHNLQRSGIFCRG